MNVKRLGWGMADQKIMCFLLWTVAVIGCCGPLQAGAQDSTLVTPGTSMPRLDTPVTDANSVRVDFGGAVLRVPEFLVNPQRIPVDRHQAIQMDGLAFAYWYPDMSMTSLLARGSTPPGVNSVKGKGRIKIYVSWLSYSPDERFSPDGTMQRIARPSDILAVKNSIGLSPEIFPTPYPGLRSVSYLKASLKMFPDLRTHPQGPSSGHVYIQSEDSPYELYMDCDRSCNAVIYSKSHHFIIHLWLYAPDSVVASQADQIFKALNHVVDAWVAK